MKRFGKKAMILLTALVMVLALSGGITAGTAKGEGMTVLTGAMKTLQSGTYRVIEDVTFTGGTGKSGLTIAEGADVTIFINAGVTLTATGGNASDASKKRGAGAGIEVPESATLTLLGQGTVIATGGNAARGQNGANGEDAYLGKRYDGLILYYGGHGGRGGNGGGGAGAGIGTRGADSVNATVGGEGGTGIILMKFQNPGDITPCRARKNGNPCGRIVIDDELTMIVTGGTSDINAVSSRGSNGNSVIEYVQGYKNTVAGGGGGGCGGRGGAGAAYGTGGQSGQSGEGGSGGAYHATSSTMMGRQGASGFAGKDGVAYDPYIADKPVVISEVTGAVLTYGYTEGSVSVTASAEPDYTMTYQWYINTQESTTGGTAIDPEAEPSAATEEYILPTGKPTGTVEYYYCEVTAMDEYGEDETPYLAVSDAAVVEVKPKDPDGIRITPDHPTWPETVTFEVRDGDETVSEDQYSISYAGRNGTVYPGEGGDASVSPAAAGDFTATFTFSGNYAGEKTAVFTVLPRALTDNMVKLDPVAFLYDGNSHAPAVTVTDGGTILTAEQDYAVSGMTEAADISTDSEYVILVYGRGNYSGTVTEPWSIKEHISTVAVLPTASAITYGQTLANSMLIGGSAVDQHGIEVPGTFTWSDPAVSPLVSDSNQTEYEVDFTPDDPTIAPAGCTVKVTVDPAAAWVTRAPKVKAGLTYNGSAQVLFEEGAALGGTMRYAVTEDGTAPEGPAAYTTAAWAMTDAKLYTVWYYALGDENHSDSAPGNISVAIEPKALTDNMVKLDPAAFVYDGNSHAPTLTVKDGGTVLTADRDYSVTGTAEAADISTGNGYEITVSGKGNYNGSITEPWMIKAHISVIKAVPTASAITFGQPLANSQLTGGSVVDQDGNAVAGKFVWAEASIQPAVSDSDQTEYEVDFIPDDETVAGTFCTVKLTVNKANAVITTAPKAAAGLVYNGKAQVLFEKGTASGGTLLYAVTESEQVPADLTVYTTAAWAKTDAKTYMVWYYALGDENHSDSAVECVPVTIAPKALTGNMTRLEPAAFVYDGTSHGPDVIVRDGETRLIENRDYTISGTTEAADFSTEDAYEITVTGAGNYGGSVTESWIIKEYITTVTEVPTASAISYGQTLMDSVLTGGSAADQNGNPVSGTFAWNDDGIWPAVSDSDRTEYEVIFLPENDIYAVTYCSVTVTVNRAAATVDTDPTARELACNGQAQELVNPGTAQGGTLAYAIGWDAVNAPAAGWDTAIPTGTDAGTYFIWYKAAGDENHLDSEASFLTVTIAEAETQETEEGGKSGEKKPDEGGKTAPEKITDGLYQDPSLGWVLLKGGKVWTDYTDLYNDKVYGLWFVRDGKIDWAFTGLYNDKVYGWQLIHEGTICKWYNGLFCDQTYGWWLVQEGAVSFGYNGLWNDPNCGWWLIKDGAVDFSFTGLHYEEEYGWWLIHKGAIAADYNGFYYDANCGWWLVRGGTIAFDYNGLCYDMNYGWWLIKDGTIDFSYNGLVYDANCGWWLISGGRVDFDYTGLYYEEQYGWWLIHQGAIAADYNGLYCDANCGWWLIQGGTVAFDYNGLCYDAQYGWWLIEGGTIFRDFSGLYDDWTCGRWLVLDGRVAFDFTGEYDDYRLGWCYVNEGKYDWDYVHTGN